MKPTYLLPTILVSLLAIPSNGEPIERIPLTYQQPVEISIGEKTATTLQFPRPIQGIFGYGLTTGDAPGTYHYTHPPGSRLLALRNLTPDKDSYVTVLLGEDDLFVLHLTHSPAPPVTIHLTEAGEEESRKLALPIDSRDAESRKLDNSTAKLFDLLKLGRNERVFRAALPHLYKNVESKKVTFQSDDDHVATVVTAIHRFPDDDAVFLGGTITNSTDDAQFFDPGALKVKVGKRSYPVTLTDCAAEIPAGGKIPFHVLLQGDVEGKRAHLSIKNEFRLVMPAYAKCTGDLALTEATGLVTEPLNQEGASK